MFPSVCTCTCTEHVKTHTQDPRSSCSLKRGLGGSRDTQTNHYSRVCTSWVVNCVVPHLLDSGSVCARRQGEASPGRMCRASSVGGEQAAQQEQIPVLAGTRSFCSVFLIFTNLVGDNGTIFVFICVSLIITEPELFSYIFISYLYLFFYGFLVH